MRTRLLVRLPLVAGMVLVLIASASAQPDLTLSTATSPSDCFYICPAGDGQSLSGITVTLLDATGSPVVGYPATQIWADAVNVGDLTYCDTPFLANGPTNNQGQTTISGTVAGGGYTNLMTVYVGGSPLVGSPLDITVVSPDISGDGVVNLCDVDLFAADMGGTAYRSDFNCDGIVNLADIIIFTAHYCHSCPDYSYGNIPTAGEIGIFFDTAGTQTGILGVPNGSLFNFYVVSLGAPGGIAGYEFGINVDARIQLISATTYPASGVNVGSLPDISVGTGGNCLPATGPTVLVDVLAILVSSDLVIPICLVGSSSSCLPNNTGPAYVVCNTDCEWRYFGTAYDGCAIVNGQGPIAVESETWSTIKSLYRN